MLIFTKNNLFETDADLLVNTVNTVGVMGKGIALEFKQRFPENYKVYKKACNNNELNIGSILMVHDNGKLILNFPTKKHWINNSEYEYIELGLKSLRNILIQRNKIFPLSKIAIPKLGCSNGKLDWEIIKPMIIKYLNDINMIIYIIEN